MATRRILLPLDTDTCQRIVHRARSEPSTMQNVIVAACRHRIGEPQRGRVGHAGRRPETRLGGPENLLDLKGWPEPVLTLDIGETTCRGLDTLGRAEPSPIETVIVAAVRAWLV